MAFEYTAIDVRREGAIDWVTLNRPERLNALTQTLFIELLDYFQRLRSDDTCRVVVLRGAGKGFCAGLDIKEAVTGGDALKGMDGADTLAPRLFDLIPAMRECPQPIIGAINGVALGGGFAIALACDVRIAALEARMVTGFTHIGLSGCELGTTFFLPRIVGMGIATELMYTARPVSAERALAIGLVSEAVPGDRLQAAARALAEDMLKVSPLGLRRTKEVFNLCLELNSLKAVLKIEENTQSKLSRTGEMEHRFQQFVSKK